MKKVFSIILGGGAGTRLNPLTLRRAKPAVSNALSISIVLAESHMGYLNFNT